MRAIVGRLVAPADPVRLARHLDEQRRDGWASNVNLLGEAVLGDAEADRRRDALLALIADPEVDYVSVKLSSVVAQLPPWAHDEALDAVADRLATLLDAAAATSPPTFVNVDMEEYRDLELTLDAFERVLDDPTRRGVEAGIVLQAYLPDALGALQRLSAWAARRVATGGAPIKVRLVKGANLAMEQTEAQLHGWPQAPYGSKAETDANYVRCVDWVLNPERMAGLRIGLASHNLFHVALTRLLAERRGVLDRVQFEMLQGMAEAQAAAAADDLGGSGHRPLLYVPTVDPDDFDVAIGYLFRRLDENAAPDHFLRALFSLAPDSPTFAAEATRFRASVTDRNRPTMTPLRVQDRRGRAVRAFEPGEPFRNEPDTDPVLPANRAWLDAVGRIEVPALAAAVPGDVAEIDAAAARARPAQARWAAVPPATRRLVLHRIGDELAARRGLLVATMAAEAGKVIGEADPEVSEAIDFARYDAERAVELARPGLRFEPLGLVAVVPPWNFPVAIPAGGVLAALAAGNAVLFKPAPETRRCAEVVYDAVVAGLETIDDVDARDLVAFVPTDDDACGRRVIETAAAVVLTGASETAELFRSWNPELRLFAETSGKNALVITPSADLDLAIADLVRSAFGHAGQKCSAASLAICVGGVARSERFRRQLVDAVTSLTVGAADDPAATVGPLIGTPNPRLARALTRLDAGESWLVEPRLLDADHHRWTPGVRTGVQPGSWFARTECFGPVLGIVEVDTLDDAIAVQNASTFGLTGGIHSLDPDETDRWLAAAEVGNAYVNRHITGAIVQRQPFGGWKRSSVGPGAKAGGPNYVAQLGTWHDAGPAAAHDDAA
ncbi:MAG: bifunctional proline dehydrogenase/L-glutamate gamma-semialdehyde dehydrogenase, partial [Acidimicrobiales bacterium]